MASDRPQPLVTGSRAPGRLFTTWLTSVDRVDHAVTDEEFTEHTPEPEAVCGAVILLAPMEWAPGPHCPRCLAFLCARDSLRDLPERIGVPRHRRAGWLYRLVHATMTPVVPRQRAGARHDRSGPPAELTRPGLSAGPDHPAAARSDSTAAGPQPSAAVRSHLAAAEAHSPVDSLPGEPASSTSAPAISCQIASGVGADGSPAAMGRAAAPPLSPLEERRGTQTPVDAACSTPDAAAGLHAPLRDASR